MGERVASILFGLLSVVSGALPVTRALPPGVLAATRRPWASPVYFSLHLRAKSDKG